MARRSITDDGDQPLGIDLSPMIDCVFILLIFFIVTTVFVEETGIEVNKPDAASSINLEQNSLLIAISADNKVIYGGREVGVSGIVAQIKPLLLQDDLPVIIQSDKAASHGVFSQVYGEVKRAGATKISFSTQN